MTKSIEYQTDRIANYFKHHRVRWEQFYQSERLIVERLSPAKSDTVLDIGCGCGGLGLALRDRFSVEQYTGIEINSLAAMSAQELNPSAEIYCGDFLDLHRLLLKGRHFDLVFSLSCFDWNVRFTDMLRAAWKHVAPGGALVATFRLVAGEGCDDIKRSYQFINFDGAMEGERASYVVLNAAELASKLIQLNPSTISAFGYFGAPSPTAVTPYDEVCFSAFSVRKRHLTDRASIQLDLSLPGDIEAKFGVHP
ncbi:MAG: class I SAM-dependent methyltransferase [Sulfuritalea sp.]|nr:class I SAM-dependent methyltransferase [Sulfuritalea sp.]